MYINRWLTRAKGPTWPGRFWLVSAGSAVALSLISEWGCSREPGNQPNSQPTAVALIPISNMVLIKAGTFMRMKYPVTLTRDFWLGKYEVTQGEYLGLLGKNPSHFTGDTNRPVEKVTYYEAEGYCQELTRREQKAGHLPSDYAYRLPTEAEWEYACGAGTTNLFYFGNSADEAGTYAWTVENADGTTHPVGQKQPNRLGLYDMHGNVWEWCSDWFAPYPAAPLTDPKGASPSKFKVFRGGGWNQAVEFARTRNRFMMAPSNGIHFVGFRVALGPMVP
jgi:formylglycine-generating enzyme required for sulfatase activity